MRIRRKKKAFKSASYWILNKLKDEPFIYLAFFCLFNPLLTLSCFSVAPNWAITPRLIVDLAATKRAIRLFEPDSIFDSKKIKFWGLDRNASSDVLKKLGGGAFGRGGHCREKMDLRPSPPHSYPPMLRRHRPIDR